MDIHDIPYSHIKVFLIANKKLIDDDQLFNYNLAFELMKNPNTNYGDIKIEMDGVYYNQVPSSIIQWMLAFNLIKLNIDIPYYTKSEIGKLSTQELNNLANKLGIKKKIYASYIIDVIKFLHKLKENPNCVLFDDAVYDTGHSYCFFNVKCKNAVANFRLHFDDELCWDFFRLIDCDNLNPEPQSNALIYGGNKKHKIYKGKKLEINEEILANFNWLSDFLEKYMYESKAVDIFKGRAFIYYGVDFYEAL